MQFDPRAEVGIMSPLLVPEPTATIDELRTYFHQLWSARAVQHAQILAYGTQDENAHRHHSFCQRHAEAEAQKWFRRIGAK